MVALVKPIFPRHTGMWIGGPDGFTMGLQFFPPGPPAHEVLGQMIIPICLIIGAAVVLLTAGIVASFSARRVSSRTNSNPTRNPSPIPQPRTSLLVSSLSPFCSPKGCEPRRREGNSALFLHSVPTPASWTPRSPG